MRSTSQWCIWVVGAAILLAPDAMAQERRSRITPGLVLETGARHAPCDALLFSPSGLELLAAGDDKVVRVWRVGKQSLLPSGGRVLRWPIYREQRGGIYAAVLSPNDGGKRIAIGGFGVKTGLVSVLDRQSGDVLHVMEQPLSAQVTTALAWSPDGRFLILGSADGELFRWEPASGSTSPIRFAGAPPQRNRVRLISFLDDHHFLAVFTDGKVWRRDLRQPKVEPKAPLASFRFGDLIRAALSPDRRWLLAAAQNVAGFDGSETQHVELLDLHRLGKGNAVLRITPPRLAGVDRFPTEVAFDPASKFLAIGVQESRRPPAPFSDFANVVGGRVFVYQLATGSWRLVDPEGLPIGYTVDGLAFRPARSDNADAAHQLAVAGGPNHEVRLFDFRRPAKLLSTIASPGSCLWSVAMSTNGKYLAWRDQLNPRPRHPNDRGAGPWRVFSLDLLPGQKVRAIQPAPPEDFKPSLPLLEWDEWRIRPTSSGFAWRILGPDGTDVTLDERVGLYNTRVNQIPRCYTFLPGERGKPPRLAVGHMWGISLYELRPNDVRLVRLMVGHEGDVMAVAPSPDGRLLFSAGRDQTLACWSLEDWPGNREMGATFVDQRGSVRVRNVYPGSPAWEAGLTDDDEIVMVVSRNRTGPGGFVYQTPGQSLAKYGFRLTDPRIVGATEVVRLLNRAEPSREYIFVWKHAGKQAPPQLTTVRQRPLWRFFPTRKESGNQWVIWRWRDFYYDTTSPNADRLIGWQVHSDNLKIKPIFHPLKNISSSRARASFHNPDMIWKFVKLPFQNPRIVLFPDIEPPSVQLTVATRPVKDPKNAANDRDLVLRVSARPRSDLPGQKLSRVVLWLDDSRYEKTPAIDPATGNIEATLTIPRQRLRQGRNEITLTAFNAEGGRAEAIQVVVFDDPTRPKPNLLALCIGMNDYATVKNRGFLKNLNYSRPDAETLADIFRQHGDSHLFRRAVVESLTDQQATRTAILTRLRTLASQAQPDDRLVLFLSGHGQSDAEDRFTFITASSDYQQIASMLSGEDLLRELGDIPCRKLILLDTCHSGSIISNPVRDLLRDNDRLMIFAACTIEQQANEPDPKKLIGFPELARYRHGFFTEGILEAIGHPTRFDPKKGRRIPVAAGELTETIETTVGDLLEKFSIGRTRQTPVFVPDPRQERRVDLFCKP